jgi:peptide/nickel transport system substrate-binding protein
VIGRHRVWRPAVLVVLGALVVAGLIAGLASALAASGSPAPSSGGVVLRIGELGDPDNLNPFLGTNAEAFTVWYMNYDSLVGLSAADLTPEKTTGLASDWTSTPDGKVWTFTIRPNITWQDGQPLTASDVAFTINYIVKNNQANWIAYVTNIKQATAVDVHTLRIDCARPTPALLSSLGEVPILPEHVWSKMPVKVATKSFPNEPPIIGSGPFQCVQWKKSDYLVMQANKNYWRGAPHVDQVVFQTYTNADTMGQDMKAGAIDACSQLLHAGVNMLSHEPGITAKPIEVNGYDELGFNCYTGGPSLGNPVLKDYRFRQALQWAIDKNKLCQIAYGGFAKPADTVITADYYHNPDWHWTPPADQAYTFDLAKAGQMLDAAGYPLKNGVRVDKSGKPISLRLEALASQPNEVTCGKFITGWFKALGLKITYSVVDTGALEDQMYNTVGGKFTPNYDLFLWGWYGDVDPGPILSDFTTSQINNWSDCAWSNAQYDALYTRMVSEMDQPTRVQMVYQLQQMIYEQTPYIPIAYSNDTEAWNTSRWTDWVQSPANVGNFVVPPYGYETYFQVRPQGSASTASSAGRTGVLLLIGVVVLLGVAGLLFVTIRRRSRKTEVPAEEALED